MGYRSVRHWAGLVCVSSFLACLALACTAEERAYTSVCDTALVCDDFESFAVGAAPSGKWRVVQAGGTVTVQADRAYHGAQAVKISVPKNDIFKSVMLTFDDANKLPTAGNVLYGRAMVFIESVPQTDLAWNMIIGKGKVEGAGYEALYGYGGQVATPMPDGSIESQFIAVYDTPGYYDSPPSAPHTACWSHAKGITAPVGRWACFEWKFDGPNNSMSLSVDGQTISGLGLKGTGDGCSGQDATYVWTAPSFTEIYLGWETYLPDEARVVWLDDVAISTSPLGCEAP